MISEWRGVSKSRRRVISEWRGVSESRQRVISEWRGVSESRRRVISEWRGVSKSRQCVSDCDVCTVVRAKCLCKPAANFPSPSHPCATQRMELGVRRRAHRSSLSHQLEHEFHVPRALISPALAALSITHSQTRHYVETTT